jgi:hypothetical protein
MQESNNYILHKILIFKITLAIAIFLSTFSGLAQQNSGIELLRNGPMSQWEWVATNNHEDPIIFELEKRLNDCDGVETVTIIKKTVYSSSKSDRGNTYIDDYGFNCSVSSNGDREHTKEYTILSRKFKEKKSNTSSSNTQTNSSSSSETPSCPGCTPAQIKEKEMAAKNKKRNNYSSSSQTNSSDSYNYSSNENSYSSANSSYSSTNSTSESSYQKKQREANAKWDAQQKANEQAKRDYYDQSIRRKQDIQRQNELVKQAGNIAANAINHYQKQNAANDARKAEYRRQLAEERRESEEEERREAADRRLEAERRQAEREEKERISNAQSSFLDNLYDKKIPVVVDSKEVFFVIISRNYDEQKISISPFSLFANSEYELPYKVDVIKDFKSKLSKPYVYVQGPYKSLEEQKNAVAAFQTNARNNYVSYSLIKFTYKPEFVSSSNKNADFWGEKKTNNTEPKKNVETEDFWGEKTSPKTKPKTKTKTKTKKSIWD